MRAAGALGRLGGAAAREVLREAARADPNGIVREAAAAALGEAEL